MSYESILPQLNQNSASYFGDKRLVLTCGVKIVTITNLKSHHYIQVIRSEILINIIVVLSTVAYLDLVFYFYDG